MGTSSKNIFKCMFYNAEKPHHIKHTVVNRTLLSPSGSIN